MSLPLTVEYARYTCSELPLTGGCLCGAVRYEVDASPSVSASYCHCTRCQRRTGTAASAQARVAPGRAARHQGEELVREFAPATTAGRSASARACGGALWSRSPTEEPGSSASGSGTFDGDPGIRPQWRQFVAYAAPWEPIPDDGLPRYAERPPA